MFVLHTQPELSSANLLDYFMEIAVQENTTDEILEALAKNLNNLSRQRAEDYVKSGFNPDCSWMNREAVRLDILSQHVRKLMFVGCEFLGK